MTNIRYLKLGIFILAGLTIGVAGVVVFGAGHLFSKYILIETYFDQSVQGLEVGSDVKYRGVKIGRVSEIGFVQGVYETRERTPERLRALNYVRVVCQIDAKHFPSENAQPVLEHMIANGLRLRADTQGITGTLLIQADYIRTGDGNAPPPLPIYWEPEYYYVPSAPNMIQELSDSLKHVFNRVNKIDIEAGVKQFIDTLAAIETSVEKADVEKLSSDLQASLTEFRQVCQSARQILANPRIPEILTSASQTLQRLETITANQSIPSTLASLQNSMAHIDALSASLTNSLPPLLQATSALVANQDQGLEATTLKLRQTLDEVNALLRALQSDPAQLIFSTPPPKEQF